MADIFLSYAREDRVRAEQMAQGLEGAGLDVFWDNEIPPGTTWADYIEQKLAQCKALIVLWSAESVKSQWVREEARMGRDKGVLIPVMIDRVQAPFGFGEVQAADLSDWSGQPDHPGWQRFLSAVRQFANTVPAPSTTPRPAMGTAPPRAHTPPPAAPSEKKKGGVPVWAWIVGSVVATVVVLGVIGMNMEDQPATPQPVAQAPQQQQAGAINPAPATPVQTGQSYEQQLMERLNQVTQALGSQGFQQIAQPYGGQLNQGATFNIPVTLNAGGEYRIVGVCDNDCADLDLILYDQNNNLISQDNLQDALPIVTVTPQWSGPFTVQARMHACTVQPCYYALSLYGRASGQ